MRPSHVFYLLSFLLLSPLAVFAQEGEGAQQALPPPAKVSKPLFTRHGMVYSAEISRIKPDFGNEVRANQPRYTEKVEGRDVPVEPVWAEIVLRPHPGRSVTRLDYVLASSSGEYPCLAIAKNDDAYSQLKECWTIPPGKLHERDLVRFLYALPPSEIPENQALVTLTWKLNLSSTKLPPPEIKFRILPKELPFSKVAQQPPSGSLGLTWDELHPAPPADPAAPAEETAEPAASGETSGAEAAPAENKTPEAGEAAK